MSYSSQHSAAMNGSRMSYSVFVPPGFAPEERLPLVVFLHGAGDGPDAFDRHGVSARLERAMSSGRLARAVVLLPDGGLGLWANWADETRRYEDWVVEELMPMVRARYHTAACPGACHVMGVSVGGFGALRFALHRPDRFSTVAAISAPVLDADQMYGLLSAHAYAALVPTHRIFGPVPCRSCLRADDPFHRWTSRARTGMRRIVVAWGSADRPVVAQTSRALAGHLEACSIPHDAWEFEGRHRWSSWAAVIERALKAQLRAAAGSTRVRAGAPAPAPTGWAVEEPTRTGAAEAGRRDRRCEPPARALRPRPCRTAPSPSARA
ncbi:MAG: esterase family protein [Sandaracinaceae bacterium]|nr:esterase family protein [Sandaracinaceae bacterium]